MFTGGTLGAGTRHLRAEWGRWWRAEDLTDTHIAHRILNDQYRMWRQQKQRGTAEVQQNISLLRQQQKAATYMQMQRMAQQKRGGGYGGGYSGGMGASPMISYRMMQWAQLQMRMGQEEFRHVEVTSSMLAVGRGQISAQRHRTAWIVVPLLVLAWVGLWWLSALAGLVVTLAAAFAVCAAAWVKGRTPTWRRPPVPKLLFVPPSVPAHTELAAEDAPEPFAIREAGRDPRRAREAVELALRKEAAQVAEVGVPTETDWGWSVPIVLSSGTLGTLITKLKPMATTLRVGENRIMAQRANSEDSAAVNLRVLTSNPFANPLPLPQRSPLSCSISNPFSIGVSIDGETTPIVLAGQHVLIVANSGGGKSSMVRTMAEYVTACWDAVAIDIDPTGRGLGPLRNCAAYGAYNPEDAETRLEWLLDKAKRRIASMSPTEDNFATSEKDPAIIAFVDEWPRLTKRGKEAGIALTDIGRKARVTLVMCTTDATSDKVGDAVADSFGVRILMPCRKADVPLVVGSDDAISQGWLPHKLVPSPGEWEIADAGQFYCITPRHRDPILRYVSPLGADAAAALAKERAYAGIPTLNAVPQSLAVPDSAPEVVKLLLAIFAAEGDPDTLTVALIADRLVQEDPATWGRWEDRKDRLAMFGRALKSQFRKAGVDVSTVRLDAEPGRPMAYRLTDLKDALS